MSRSYSAVYVHLVFSTKDRRPMLTDPDLRFDVHQYLGGVAKSLHCDPILVGGTADHVHMLTRLDKSIAQADLVKEVKRVSTKWLKEREPGIRDFSWQGGYGAFSVSSTDTDSVRRYIENQENHHRTRTFQEELLDLLKEHGIPFDERYLWE